MYIFDEFLNEKDFLKDIPPLHKAAVKCNCFIPKSKELKTMVLSKKQNRQLVDLEKSLDFAVLKSRMIKENENIACDGRGNIHDNRNNKKKFEIEQKKINNFVDFPVYNFNNTFSGHWNENDEKCDSNSFTLKDAGHYTLNNVVYNYNDFKEKYSQFKDSPKLLDKKWDEYIDKLANLKKIVKPKIGDYVKIVNGTYENEYAKIKEIINKKVRVDLIKQSKDACVYPLINIKDLMLVEKHWYIDQKEYNQKNIENKFKDAVEDDEDVPLLSYEIDNVSVKWKKIDIESTFGKYTEKETLNFDTRLLNNMELDVPLICIPSILRKGSADYHCVYFEDSNALGQLESRKKNFAAIIIVREDQKEEYVKRYKSDHTFFVALDTRQNSKIKGYSAGDSKYYCYRVAQYLYENHIDSRSKKVLIMDDQVMPFTHQVPYFKGNDDLKKKKKGSLEAKKIIEDDENDPIINSTYKFRQSFLDKTYKSLLYKGNCRTLITHAALLMYMEKVSDITKAGVVCLSTDEPESIHTTIRTSPFKNQVWLIDLDVCHIPTIQSPIHPAYQAAEDMLMSNVLASHDIPMVVCNTIRVRKYKTGGGTCGRNIGIPKPLIPVIKYHELLKVSTFKNISKYNLGEINDLEKYQNKIRKRTIYNVESYPFKNIKVYARIPSGEKKYATEFLSFEFKNQKYNVELKNFKKKSSEKLSINIGLSPVSWSHDYGSRHQINLILLHTLRQILIDKHPTKKIIKKSAQKHKFKFGDLVLARCSYEEDGKWKYWSYKGKKLWYNATVSEWIDEEQKYRVHYKTGYNHEKEKDIQMRFLKGDQIQVKRTNGIFNATVIKWNEAMTKQYYEVQYDDKTKGNVKKEDIVANVLAFEKNMIQLKF